MIDPSVYGAPLPRKWTSNEIKAFFRSYAKHPCLWDPNDPNYKSRSDRTWAMEEIANELGLSSDVDALKRKTHALRNTYIIELKKIVASGGSYKSKLKWFHDADKVLRKVVKLAESKTLVEEKSPTTTRSSSCEDNDTTNESSDESTETENNSPSNLETVFPSSHKRRDSGKARRNSEECHKERSSQEQKSPSNETTPTLSPQPCRIDSPVEEVIEIFNDSFITQMKRLPEKHVIELMPDIQMLISQKHLSYLKNSKREGIVSTKNLKEHPHEEAPPAKIKREKSPTYDFLPMETIGMGVTNLKHEFPFLNCSDSSRHPVRADSPPNEGPSSASPHQAHRLDSQGEEIIEIFGQSIMSQLKRLPEEYVLELMSEIQSMVSYKRLKYLKHCKAANSQ